MQRLNGKIPDLVVSILIWIVGIVGLVMAFDFPTKSGKWPIIIMSMLVFLMTLYLAAFFYDLRLKPTTEQPADDKSTDNAHKIRIGINIAIIVSFIVIAPYLGLFVTTALYLFSHMLFLGVRPIWLVALCSLGCTGVIYGFFGHLLGVYIPGGFFF